MSIRSLKMRILPLCFSITNISSLSSKVRYRSHTNGSRSISLYIVPCYLTFSGATSLSTIEKAVRDSVLGVFVFMPFRPCGFRKTKVPNLQRTQKASVIKNSQKNFYPKYPHQKTHFYTYSVWVYERPYQKLLEARKPPSKNR